MSGTPTEKAPARKNESTPSAWRSNPPSVAMSTVPPPPCRTAAVTPEAGATCEYPRVSTPAPEPNCRYATLLKITENEVPDPNPKSSGNEAHEAFTNRTPTRPTVEACSSWKASTTALLSAKLPLVTTLHQVSRSRLGRSLQSWPMGGASNLVEQSGAFG